MALTADSVQKSAVEWFDRMRAGQIDRTQLSDDFNAQLTRPTVETTSRFLQAHGFVVPPTAAKLLGTRTAKDETIYTVKLSLRAAMRQTFRSPSTPMANSATLAF